MAYYSPIATRDLEKEMASPRPLEVMKRSDGSFAVRWSNSPKRWAIIKKEDKIMFEFIVFQMLRA